MTLNQPESPVGSVVVVGGGIGGIQASLDLAESGFRVYLVEAFPSIGGTMAQLDKTFPTNDCAMCILAPKMIDCARHPNITIYSYSQVQEVSGTAGNFKVKILAHPRYVNADKCTGCATCVEKCPIVKIPNEFDAGIGLRKAVYIPFPQAVPNVATIDPARCLFLTRNVCRICEKFCQANAIDFEQEPVVYEVDTGAIILAPGVEAFDAKLKSEYGYGRYDNVVTSLEFERILSASGPFGGHIQRPSDGVAPKKLAFIQCIGSRDVTCGNDYCSAVCCMYTTKEAVIAKEHMDQIEATIFYMDMRAYGKDFDKYIERAEHEYGVNFIRCIPQIKENPSTKNLRLRYETEDGKVNEENFDLVILSVGLQPTGNIEELAKIFEVDLDKFGFCQTNEFRSCETSRPGIYTCGMFESPKDIPETVTQASAAAAAAGSLLSPMRGTLVRKHEYPDEIDIRGEPPRIGVFICHCGTNIGGVVNVPLIVDYAKTLPNVVFVDENLYTCSSDTQEYIKNKILEHNINRVVVASCTPRTHESLFQDTIREAGLNRYLFDMANIRDQCSWVHKDEPEAATRKARDLVRIAVTRAQLLQPIERIPLSINHGGLVIGGGIAGLNAALALAEEGFETYLIEKTDTLGGFAQHLRYTLEGSDIQEYIKALTETVYQNKLIHVYKNTNIEDISGYVGNFLTRVTDENGDPHLIEHGVVIVATGGEEYGPNEYLYQENPRVITQTELENGLTTGEYAEHTNIVMIQCVGSRTPDHPYCSRVCCGEAIKNALKIKTMRPEANVYILYRDIRAYGLTELYYQQAREAGITFLRYTEECKPIVTQKATDHSLSVLVHDASVNEPILLEPDLLVLSVGIVPPTGNETIGKMLKVPLNEDGFFLEAHVKLRPVDFATEGVFLCGMAHGPKTIKESVSQAYATVSRACTILSKETIDTGGTVALVNADKCIACANCEDVCEYNAIRVEKSYAEVNPLLCKGCGTCAVECPALAITMQHFTDDQVLAMIQTALEPISDLEAPKVLAFFCNWCAYAGADLAGVSRFQYPPTAKIIRVMCSGRVDETYILHAFLQGADGVLIGGCHPGDCHYMSGNLHAEERVARVQHWLKQAGIEPERLRLEWISAGEGKQLADVMQDFTNQLKKLGHNPLSTSLKR